MECLNKIIGITESDCDCIIGGLTPEEIQEIRESVSGLYLDDLEGGLQLRGIKQIDSCKNFAKMALGARDTAIKKLEADLLVALSLKYKSAKNSFVGYIGRPSYAATLNTSLANQYLKLIPNSHSDATVRVTGIRVVVDRNDTLTVSIIKVPIDANQGTIIHEFENVEVSANIYKAVDIGATPILLPLTENGEKYDYMFVYTSINGAKPKDLKFDCNCGLGKSNGYSEFLKVEGGELSDINNLNNSKKDAYSHGFSIDVDIRCYPGKLICREYDRENAIALTMAWATMYKAEELLIESVIGSNEVNRYTMMNREYLWGKRNHFKKEYESRIAYLASEIDATSSDCFVCKETKMFLGGILS